MLKRIEPQSTDRIAALVIGPSGIGKTSLLRTLCGEGFKNGKWEKYDVAVEKTCVFSAESGLLCVRDLVVSKEIQGYEINTLDEFKEAQQMCLSEGFKKEGYKWVFIDSLTEIAARCVEKYKLKYSDARDTFKLWGEYSTALTDLVKAFRDMTDFNVVFTCLEAMEKDEDGIGRLMPDIPGSALKNRLTSYFDEVFHMEKTRDASGYTVRFSTASPIGLAKDRSGKLDQYELPNLLYIKQKIFV